MAELNFNIDTSSIDTTSNYELIPDGEYVFEIVSSSLDDTKDKSGKILKLSTKIMQGKHTGRIVFCNLNLVNKSQKATEVAWKMFASLWTCLAFDTYPKDSTMLHGIPFLGLVVSEKGTNGYADKNVIKRFSKYEHLAQRPKQSAGEPVKNTKISFANGPDDDIPF